MPEPGPQASSGTPEKITVVCHGCGARYKVRDPKVRGRRFRAACKKCGGIIVARCDNAGFTVLPNSGEGGKEASPVRLASTDLHQDEDPEWFLAIDDETYGPYTPQQVQDFIVAGRVDADTNVWRNEQQEWLPLGDTSQFGHMVSGAMPGVPDPLMSSEPMDPGDTEVGTVDGYGGLGPSSDAPEHLPPDVLDDEGEEMEAAPTRIAQVDFEKLRSKRKADAGASSDLWDRQGADDDEDKDWRRIASRVGAPGDARVAEAASSDIFARRDGTADADVGAWSPPPRARPVLPNPTGQLDGPAPGGPPRRATRPLTEQERQAATVSPEGMYIPPMDGAPALGVPAGPAPITPGAAGSEPAPSFSSLIRVSAGQRPNDMPALPSQLPPPLDAPGAAAPAAGGMVGLPPVMLQPTPEPFWTTPKIIAASVVSGLLVLALILFVVMRFARAPQPSAVDLAVAAVDKNTATAGGVPGTAANSVVPITVKQVAPAPAAPAPAAPAPAPAPASAPAPAPASAAAPAPAPAPAPSRVASAPRASSGDGERTRIRTRRSAPARPRTPRTRVVPADKPPRAPKPRPRRARSRDLADDILGGVDKKPRRRPSRRRAASADDLLAPGRDSPPPSKRRRRRSSASADDILAAGSGSSSPRRRRASSGANLPATLNRSQVQAGMRKLRPRVSACFSRFRRQGTLRLQVNIRKNGRARGRAVGGFAGSSTASCVAKGLARLRFPKFSGAAIKFVYPFVLR